MKDYGKFFKFFRKMGQWLTPSYDTSQIEKINDDGSHIVYVSHHQNMHGVFSVMFWLSEKIPFRVWAFHMFLDQKTTYDHYMDFTFTERFGWPRWFASLIAKPLSHFVERLANSARCIPVYRKSRKILETFDESMVALKGGWSPLIFPDVNYDSDEDKTEDIYEGFLHIEKKSMRETGKHVKFVPILANKEDRIIYQAEPVMFNDDEKFIKQRPKVAEAIRESLNKLANQ